MTLAEELLALTLTFLNMKESNVSIEEGETKEFLRGTFSLMDFDQRSTSALDELKVKVPTYMCVIVVQRFQFKSTNTFLLLHHLPFFFNMN